MFAFIRYSTDVSPCSPSEGSVASVGVFVQPAVGAHLVDDYPASVPVHAGLAQSWEWPSVHRLRRVKCDTLGPLPSGRRR